MFTFNEKTNEKVKSVLIKAYQNNIRIRIWYGDTDSGRSWMDEYDVIGTVGSSTGTQKIPLLIKNSRSDGGGAILCHCIIRIDCTNGDNLYKHPRFNVGTLTTKPIVDPEYSTMVLQDNNHIATFKTQVQADRWVSFMKGERYAK